MVVPCRRGRITRNGPKLLRQRGAIRGGRLPGRTPAHPDPPTGEDRDGQPRYLYLIHPTQADGSCQREYIGTISPTGTCADMYVVTAQVATCFFFSPICRLADLLPIALINEKFKRIAALGIQIHGAIGFTEDHDLPLYFKRAKAWEINLGNTSFHLDKIAKREGIGRVSRVAKE